MMSRFRLRWPHRPGRRKRERCCLFHPDCNRWPRNFTGSPALSHRVAGLPAREGAAVLTASEDFHLALKQNSRGTL